jgi:hypothetical protein
VNGYTLTSVGALCEHPAPETRTGTCREPQPNGKCLVRSAEDRGFEPRRVLPPNRISSAPPQPADLYRTVPLDADKGRSSRSRHVLAASRCRGMPSLADKIWHVRAHRVPTRDSGPSTSVGLTSSVCLAAVYLLLVAQSVSVPEKTLKHWTSLRKLTGRCASPARLCLSRPTA